MSDLVQVEERIEKCQRILDSDPNSQIFAALAEAYRRKGETEKAFRICQNGLKVHPSYGSAHLVMAKINLDRGHYDWAEIEVKRAMELDGRTRAIELLLAEVLIYKGEFSQAIRLLSRLYEIDPGNTQIKKLLDIAKRIPEEQVQQMKAEGAVEEPKRVEPVKEPAPKETEPQTYSTKELLTHGISLAGVDGVLFLNGEGLLVESEWSLETDAELCGATLADVSHFLDRELVKSSFGLVEKILIETPKRIFYLIRISEGLLVFVAKGSENLGGLRMKIESLLARHR
jgi:predicted regulator of Ras-like GTPase activity (Roadblock/LC7/MglB family)/lipopolysaccharide biosynthesis regulator YciM